jgi:hypothetical protein
MKQQTTMRRARRPAAIGSVLAVGLMFAGAPALAQQQLNSALQTSQLAVQETDRSQGRIDQLDAQTQSLLNDYRANLKQLEQLRRYNQSQRRQVEAQGNEIVSLRQDIDNISSLQRSVQPLMEDMLAALGTLVEADMPYLLDERRDRIARLQAIMENPAQSPAQRYRLITEAYQIENEYGRTIEAYRSDVTVDGKTYENAEFLRIGRLALIFKTDDDEVLKIYDAGAKQWLNLDGSFLGEVKTALRMAKEQIPPNLLTVPLPAPQEANQQEG